MTVRSKMPEYARRYDKLRRHGWVANRDGAITRRKLAALQAIGHTLSSMAIDLGVSQQRLSSLFNGEGPIHWRTEFDVAQLYNRLHMQPVLTLYGERAAKRARALGYAPPLAWDDIDNPHEEPQGMREEA